jgi:hypothetical protein
MKKALISFAITFSVLLSTLAFAAPPAIPATPINVTAIAHNGQATISFDTTNSSEYITSFRVTSYPEGITKDTLSTNIIVTGLTNGTAYTFTVIANGVSTQSIESVASNEVTPCNYSAPLATADSVCNEGKVNLAVTLIERTKGAPISDYTWFDTNNNIVGSGINYTTPTIYETTAYAVSFTYLGCETAKTAINAVVNHSPAQPVVTTAPILCDSGSVLFSASNPILRANTTNDISYEWRNNQRQLLASTADFQTPKLYTGTYFLVTATHKGCVSDTSSASVNVLHIDAPQGVDSLICGPGKVRLHAMSAPSRIASPANPTINWYDNINGSSIGNGALFETPTIATTTDYYASVTILGCESPKTKVVAMVINKPALPMVEQSTFPCDSGSVLLNLTYPLTRAQQYGDITYDWTDLNHNLLGTGESFQTPVLHEMTMFSYIRKVEGCEKADTSFITVALGNPYIPLGVDSTTCGPGSVRLHAINVLERTNKALSSEFYWYDVPTGGAHIGSGELFETPYITSPTTYYAVLSQNGCESERVPVQAIVKSRPAMPTVHHSKEYLCKGESVLLSASVSPLRQANCRNCGDNNTYEWRDINHNVVFNDADFQTSKLYNSTTYSLTASYDGCTSDTAFITVPVIILQSPLLTDTSMCGPGIATLHATLQGPLRTNIPANPTINWYESPTKDSIIATGESFTSSEQNGFGYRYYYAKVSLMGCSSQITETYINNIPIPNPPFVQTPDSKCDSGSFVLQVLLQGQINCRGNCGDPNEYVWTDVNDNIKSNSAIFNTDLLKNTTTYNVKAIYDGCYSEPTQVTAQVIHAWQPMATDSAICGEGTTKLSIQIPVREKARMKGCDNCLTYAWTNEANDTVGYGTSFMTPIINKNTTYYVQSSEQGCISPKTEVVTRVSLELPTITTQPISQYVCLGDSVTLKIKATSTDPHYYLCIYYGEGAIQPAVETDTLFGFRPDNSINDVKLVYISYNNCGLDTSNVFEVRVNQADTLVTNTNNTLSVQTQNATYQWINADTKAIIDGETSSSFTPTVSGNYAAIISLTDCKTNDTTGTHYVNNIINGLNDMPNASFIVFPNPATDILNIALHESITGNASITDIHGNVVASKTVTGSQFNISTAELSSGVYVLKIASAAQTITKQVVIVK